MPDDQAQLRHARESVMRKYVDLAEPADIGARFDEIVADFDGAPIRAYVPVLAERRLREVLTRDR